MKYNSVCFILRTSLIIINYKTFNWSNQISILCVTFSWKLRCNIRPHSDDSVGLLCGLNSIPDHADCTAEFTVPPLNVFLPFLFQRLHELHPNLSEEDIAKLAAAKMSSETSHDRLWYRINATKALGGNPRLTPSMSVKLHEVGNHGNWSLRI